MKDKIIMGLTILVVILSVLIFVVNSKDVKLIYIYENLMIEEIEEIEGLNHWNIRRYGGVFGDISYYVDIDIERRDTKMEFGRDFDSINDINKNIQSIIDEINKLK